MADDTKAVVERVYAAWKTRDVMDGRLRHQWQVETGKAQRLDEWHDIPAVSAYFQKVALNLAAQKQ
jgi:hypothetical protein